MWAPADAQTYAPRRTQLVALRCLITGCSRCTATESTPETSYNLLRPSPRRGQRVRLPQSEDC
eukprot:scaffold503_cov365-Prasinococcus_capsulatus_cf.AAC.9